MARGVHVVHLDGTSLTWSHDMAAASGNTHESTYVLPLLTAGEHTVRTTLLDASVLTEEEMVLGTHA